MMTENTIEMNIETVSTILEGVSQDLWRYLITDKQRELVSEIKEMIVGVNQDAYEQGHYETTSINDVLVAIINGEMLEHPFSKNYPVEILQNSLEYKSMSRVYNELKQLTQEWILRLDYFQALDKLPKGLLASSCVTIINKEDVTFLFGSENTKPRRYTMNRKIWEQEKMHVA